MSTTIVFESAVIADAVKKAARVAPAKSGHAFDRAAGLLIDIYPQDDVKCLIRSTNLDVFYCEVVGCVEVEGKETRWRLPSTVLSTVVGTLPIGSGRQVTFKQEKNQVIITAGRMKATMQLMDPDSYPEWELFDSNGMTIVSNLGGKISQVEWAASAKNDIPYSGIHLDGEFITATDRYRLARIPCQIDLPRPVVVPAGLLGSAIRQTGETGIAVLGSTLQLSPDPYCQVQTVIFDADFPNVSKITSQTYPQRVEIRKSDLLEKINRATAYQGADRSPVLRTYFGREEIGVMMSNHEIGMLGDVVECPGSITHKRVMINFTPKNLTQAIEKAPSDRVVLCYDDVNVLRPMHISDGSGYEAWVVPRKDIESNS